MVKLKRTGFKNRTERLQWEERNMEEIFSNIMLSKDDVLAMQSYIFEIIGNAEKVKMLSDKKYGEWTFDDMKEFDEWVLHVTDGVREKIKEFEHLYKFVKLMRKEETSK